MPAIRKKERNGPGITTVAEGLIDDGVSSGILAACKLHEEK
jgi:hypothetical protein